jgi:high affinity Mn2+ porin
MSKPVCFISLLIIVTPFLIRGQENLKQYLSADDTIKPELWNFHFQTTVIAQYHPTFKSLYTGINSLDPAAETDISITTTLFFGIRLWKGAQFYFNPELSAGSGFSKTTGIAGFPNGEIYRVSNPSPNIYIARLYFRQLFALSKEHDHVEDGINDLRSEIPRSYISLTAGKFSIMDFFDNNRFSHDPRTQFYNWVLMGNGAWDYPANTRGYTYGFALEYVDPSWALRYSLVMVPKEANGSVMDENVFRSNSMALEFQKNWQLLKHGGKVLLMTYFTQARMGNYQQAIDLGKFNDTIPMVTQVRALGHTKYGFGVNIEQEFLKNSGVFLRAGWNDGHNETWAFTEIDRAISIGVSFNGIYWKRAADNLGIAFIINGLSEDHRHYLESGGYGFIIGDGYVNYAPECIMELYYSFRLFDKWLWISPDWQFILNPAYNRDRGPVNAFGIRVHTEF